MERSRAALDLVLHPDARNERIPASACRYLQTLLEDSGQYEHQFTLEADAISSYVVLSLPAEAVALNSVASDTQVSASSE